MINGIKNRARYSKLQKCEQQGINRYRDDSNYERMSLIPRISTKEKKE